MKPRNYYVVHYVRFAPLTFRIRGSRRTTWQLPPVPAQGVDAKKLTTCIKGHVSGQKNIHDSAAYPEGFASELIAYHLHFMAKDCSRGVEGGRSAA